MVNISTLLIGDIDRPEFHDIRAPLETAGAVVAVDDIPSAVAAIDRQRITPDLIVLAQAFPSQFLDHEVEHLRRLAPLARVLALLGSWCEGEMRTGRPWPGTVRVYWHQFPAQCGRELERLRAGEHSVWGLPVTATDEERLLLSAQEPFTKHAGLVAIHTHRGEIEEWLSAACRASGYATVWLRPPRPTHVEGALAVIFDGTDGHRVEHERLKRLAESFAGTPIIALLDFPRIEDHRRAKSAGAAVVLSKPLQLDDLFWELGRLVRIPA